MSEYTHNCDTCTQNCESRGGIQKEKANSKSNIKKAIAELMRELQKGEDRAKEKGYIDISDVEKIIKMK